MKKLAIGFGALVVVVLAVALALPAFIDWNQYRARLAGEASDALGRTVEIRGNIGLALLPAPVFSVNDAHIANVEGAADVDMMSLASLEVRVAWVPLLVGTVRIESVKLVRPVVSVEIMEGGRSNMTFGRRAADAQTRGLQPKIPLTTGVNVATSDDGGIAFSIDNFVVEKGTVVFRNSAADRVERIDNITGRFSIDSLRGPYNAVASAVVRGIPVSVDVEAGTIIQGRTMPISFDVTATPGGVKAQFSGSLNTIDEAPRLKGRLTAEGQNLQEFATAFGVALPDALRRTFGAVGNLSAGVDGGDLTDLGVKLDTIQAQGRLAVVLGAQQRIDATLTATRVDLDAFMKPTPAASKAEPATSSKGSPTEAQIKSQPRAPQASGGGFSLEALPDELTANLNLAIEALTWRGEAIRQAKLNLSLDNGELTVNQATAMLPGGSDVALFGFVTERDAMPQFDGTLDVSSNDLRGALDWLGMSTALVPAERLRRLTLAAKLSARPGAASLTDLNVRLDGVQIGGSTTMEFNERLSLGVNVTVDRLNVDAYAPAPVAAKGSDEAPALPSQSGTAPKPTLPAAMNPLAALAPLGLFDADVRARAGSLTYKGLPFNDVRLEATLRDGVLDVKSLSVADLVGIGASLSGAVNGLKRIGSADADPQLKDMVLDAKGKTLGPLLRMAAIDSPIQPDALGPSALMLRLNGGLRALDVAVELATMGGKGSLSGRLQGRELIPRFDGRFALAHPDMVRFVRAFGADYRPKAAKGGIDVAGKIGASLLELGMSELAGTVAGVRVQGSAGMATLGRRPRIAVKLATGDLDLEAFMPQRRTAAVDDIPRIIPAAFNAVPRAAVPRDVVHTAAPWTNDRIDVRALGLVDGTIAVVSDSLRYGGLSVINADLDAELREGALVMHRFIGKSYGGDLTVDGALVPDGDGVKFQARYALGAADVGAAERAFGGKGLSKGSVTSEGQLTGGGRSTAEIASSLNGGGAFALRGLDAGDGAGTLGALASSVNRIAAVTGGGQKTGLLDLSGPYRVSNGIATFDELAFTSSVGEGALKGKIDLPKWTIATRGELRLAKNLLSELVLKDPGVAKPIPFDIEGSLDAPRVRVDIASLPGGGLRVPLDRLRERIMPAPKSAAPRAPARPVPPVTQEAAPPPPQQAQPQPTPTPAAPAQTPSTQAEPKRAERAQDILRDILKGIGR